MIKDTFFSMPRFMSLCRKEMVENWRVNVLRMVLLYGVMAIVMLWGTHYEYKFFNLERSRTSDPGWEYILMAFMWFLFFFGTLSASLTMEKMKSKTSRLSALMTPGTPFEKFFSRWLISTVVFLVVFFIAFELADLTRVLVYSLVYPDLSDVIAPVCLDDLAGHGGDGRWHLFDESYELLAFLAGYCFVQSLFVLGSSIWPKNSYLKTFAAGAVIVLFYVMVGGLLGEMLFNQCNMDYDFAFYPSDRQAATIATIVGLFFTLVNWTLAYFRFKESEIIQRM